MINYLKSRYMPVTKCMYMNHVGQSQCRTFLPQGKVIESIVVTARDGNDHLRLLLQMVGHTYPCVGARCSHDGRAHLPMQVPGIPMAHLQEKRSQGALRCPVPTASYKGRVFQASLFQTSDFILRYTRDQHIQLSKFKLINLREFNMVNNFRKIGCF